MSSINQNPQTLSALYKAALSEGKSLAAVVAAIQACNPVWGNVEQMALIADAYKAGRISASLGVNEKEARRIIGMKPFDEHVLNPGDDRRTLPQHKAARAAIAAWSRVREAAGAPSAQTGKKRGARGATAAPKGADASGNSLGAEAVIPAITRAKSTADVNAYALRMAQNVKRYLDMNAKFAVGEFGGALRTFVASVAQAGKSHQENVADKPRTIQSVDKAA